MAENRSQFLFGESRLRREAVSDSIDLHNNELHLAVLNENIESCIQIIEEKRFDINQGNAKGDTPLHLASRRQFRTSLIFDILVNSGANVNAENKWKQTPLHYAAIAQSLDTIKILVNTSDIVVNAVDVNGYNALHYFIASNTGNNTKHPDLGIVTEISKHCETGLCVLIGAGVSVNSQTKYGHSILHIAAVRDDNTPLLKYIMTYCTSIDLTLKTIMDETFLHVYVEYELPEEVMTIFLELFQSNRQVFKILLNTGNILGQTPWSIMIENGDIMADDKTETLETILIYGAYIDRSDNLGNTILHRIAGVSFGNLNCDFLEVLIRNGAELNATNIFGESPAFVAFLEQIFDLFKRHNMKFKAVDRWGRSPLVSIMKHRPIPSFFEKLIQEGDLDVNEKDIYNSSPLHFAAYHNFPEQNEILLKYGANKGSVDDLQEKPIDTAKRHCSFKCLKLLSENDEREQAVVNTRKSLEEILFDMPRAINSSSITSYYELKSILNVPGDINLFLDSLLAAYFEREQVNAREVQKITLEVNVLVESICNYLVGYDSRFKVTVFPTGSSAEGTKVGRPDEFDFILCLKKLDELCDVVITQQCLNTGYACLKFKDVPVNDDFVSFSDLDGYFLAFTFLQLFFRYLQRALNEAEIWNKGNLYYNFENKMIVINGKPVFNFDVYWIGSVYKQLKISIDLVPAVYKPGWWPPTVSLNTMTLMNEKIMAAGCFLILQTRSNEFNSKHTKLNFSISYTCNADETYEASIQKRLLRISATPAEISLMKYMPEKIRRAYVLAKILKMKEICPEINIESQPHFSDFRRRDALPIKPSKFIKSYMLKTCTFYAYEEMQTGCLELSTVTDITAKIISNLFQHFQQAELKVFKPYFLPYSDVFEFEKDVPKNFKAKVLLSTSRELSIKVILAILNRPFPKK